MAMVTTDAMAAVWRLMWLMMVLPVAPILLAAAWLSSLPTVKAKAAVKSRKAAVTMQASTMAAMKRRLMGAIWGEGVGMKGASGDSTAAVTGWAARRMEDHSGSTD